MPLLHFTLAFDQLIQTYGSQNLAKWRHWNECNGYYRVIQISRSALCRDYTQSSSSLSSSFQFNTSLDMDGIPLKCNVRPREIGF